MTRQLTLCKFISRNENYTQIMSMDTSTTHRQKQILEIFFFFLSETSIGNTGAVIYTAYMNGIRHNQSYINTNSWLLNSRILKCILISFKLIIWHRKMQGEASIYMDLKQLGLSYIHNLKNKRNCETTVTVLCRSSQNSRSKGCLVFREVREKNVMERK